MLENTLKEKIIDAKFIRYINLMFKEGFLSDRGLRTSKEKQRRINMQSRSRECLSPSCDRHLD